MQALLLSESSEEAYLTAFRQVAQSAHLTQTVQNAAAADALEKVTIHGEEYISVEELQQASGVGSSILDRLRQVGALGDLPESSQVSFF